MPQIEDNIQELIRQALCNHQIEVRCPECSSSIWCEPDAKSAYCYGCKKVVDDINPLINFGLTLRRV